MDRRTFLKTATMGTLVVGLAKGAFALDTNYPVKVDAALFETINRVKDVSNKTPLEKTHAPFLTAPSEVKAGEPFTVEVSVGEKVRDACRDYPCFAGASSGQYQQRPVSIQDCLLLSRVETGNFFIHNGKVYYLFDRIKANEE